MATTAGEGPAGPSAEILGRLLVIQQAIDAMPDEVRIADFVRRALTDVPGIADVYVHLEGHTTPPNERLADLFRRCSHQTAEGTPANSLLKLGNEAQCFIIEAPGQRFGWLVLEVKDEAALLPYRAFLSNISSTISRIVSSRLYQSRLAQVNEELRHARDNLEMRVAERTRELEYRATHDQLTGLANRALLLDRLHGAICAAERDGRMVVVVYLDLDSFKFMNTGLGNACGDQFLSETARRLARLVRDSDTVARIGSDEFVILLTGLDHIERSSARLNAMLAAVREPVRLAGREVVVTCSIGACVYPLDGDEAELLLRRANSAMHRAKGTGKDSIQFYASTRDAAVGERMELETELRQAIPGGQLVVHYQPKLDLNEGRYRGAEALVRWEHPKRGLLQPMQFIPRFGCSHAIHSAGGRLGADHCPRRACDAAGLPAGPALA
jgi:diguanylate cyclase